MVERANISPLVSAGLLDFDNVGAEVRQDPTTKEAFVISEV